jgi:gamma-glutamyltranspeptidase/glutathione hydrolase
MAMSTPGGDNQDQALLQIFLNVAEHGMNAQQAAEAPRFQTRHLVSSFDNHAMNPGELFVDERVAADTYLALQRKGHVVARRSRWSSGSHPVLIRILPNGVLETGVDPYGYRIAQAW